MTTPEWKLRVYGHATTGNARKRRPGKRIKEEITAKQDGRCLYCDLKIGTCVIRRGNVVALRAAWDHFVPYAYLRGNPRHNWVLACHVCNTLKGCRLFTTVIEVQAFLRQERLQRGYAAFDWEERPA